MTHAGEAKVGRLLAEAGALGTVRRLPAPAPTAATAARQLRVPVGAIATSVLFEAAGAPLLVVASGAHRVDPCWLAELLGVPRVTPAEADAVRRHTGHPVDGVAPIGHPEPIGTLVDVELARYDRVWAVAGDPVAVFPTTYEELLRLTGGTAAEVGDAPEEPLPPEFLAARPAQDDVVAR